MDSVTELRKLYGSTWSRKAHGMSMIEMLSAMFIMAFVGAAITELAVSHNVVAFRTAGRVDGVIKARRAMALIEQDVRTASLFPGLYEPTSTPPGDNGVATWTAPSPAYIADSQTLIIQSPLFPSTNDAGHDPIYPIGSRVVVYKILADKRKPGKGQFVLQKKDFSNASEPQTILTGIVGPINPNSAADAIAQTPPPLVFSAINRMAPYYLSKGKAGFSDSAMTNGITCSFEIYEEASSQKNSVPKTIAVTKEVYARGNYAANP